MIPTLNRLTTEYIEIEDRLRLAGELDNGEALALWLTRRLLDRLLPPLLHWLEQQEEDLPRADLLHGWAMQAARAELTPQPPVRLTTRSDQWLVQAIDLTRQREEVTLIFKGSDASQQVGLQMAVKPLRQWLAIVHDFYQIAQWPLDIWPNWLDEAALGFPAPSVVWH